ncbi:NUDIX domain-containing protein [Phytophthora cinnamomi]|uniref:NUDIX domain-containing protein n=1 Tax=Phytophthora cinnamomi TaxID=4785 RepID=UPI0035594553|nr:NUDIX domain-containing protein [Phytophthora cinnamomi]
MIPKMILGIIVLDREDKMLLLQHRNGDHWSFCKGHKEDTDTSDIHTAARELFEETKLRVPSLWMESESWEEYCTRSQNPAQDVSRGVQIQEAQQGGR